MPFGIQPVHLIIIVVVALIIFGPQRLPEIGRGLGRSLNEFKRGTRDMTEGFRDEVTKVAEGAPVTATAGPAQSGTGHFCTQCGSANGSDAKFCKTCGSQLPG